MRAINARNQRFGRLVALRRAGKYRGVEYKWRCQCDCGNRVTVRIGALRNGHTQSCGCLNKEVTRARSIGNKFGYVHGRETQNSRIRSYKRAAKKRRFEWGLTTIAAYQLMESPCCYCGAGAPNGIDRVDNKLGYTTTNVVPCCNMCNVAKNNHSLPEFLAWVQRVHSHSILQGGENGR